MAVAYRGGYNDGGAANPTSGTFSLSGTNAVAGDFAICVWYSRANTKTVSVTGPTLITSQDASNATGGHIWVGYKVITSTDITNGNVGSWTGSSVTNGTTGFIVAVFSGVDTSVGVSSYGTPAQGTAADPNPPSLSTTAGDALVAIFGTMDQNNGVSAPTNFTMATNAAWSTTSGTDGSSGVAYDLDGGTGSSVDPDTFATTTDAAWYATTLNLRAEYAPTVTLSSPNDAATVTDTTPDLVFTGTDGNSDDVRYNVQIDTVNTFDSQSGSTYGFYGSAPTTAGIILRPGSTSDMAGMSFTASSNGYINTVSFWMYKYGSPTGNVYVDLYSSTGTNGTDAKPTGSIIATSNAKDAATLAASFGKTTFTFPSGTAGVVASTQYSVVVRSTAGDASNYPIVGYDNTSSGSYNSFWSSGGSTWTTNTSDLSFEVTTNSPLLDKVSGTDSGFSGTPDNTDPFASGQAVTYTVQSALDAGTYYWRVRGIDPSGSNTYGSWATTRSFTIDTGGGSPSTTPPPQIITW